MANKKITDLVDIGTPASGDLLEIVDISEGVSKRVAVSALGGGSTPTLQEVTDEGNETTNPIRFNTDGSTVEIGCSDVSGQFYFVHEEASNFKQQFSLQEHTADRNAVFPDKDGTIAFIDDITTPTLQEVLDEGGDYTKTSGTATVTGNKGVYNAGQNSFRESFTIETTDEDVLRAAVFGASKAGIGFAHSVTDLVTGETTSSGLGMNEGVFSLESLVNDGTDESTHRIEFDIDPTLNDNLILKTPNDEIGEKVFATREWVNSNLPTIDATPTDGSANAVSSNGVFDALALKADLVNVEEWFIVQNGSLGVSSNSLAETVLYSVNITGAKYVAGDYPLIKIGATKTATNGNVTYRIRVGINGDTSDAIFATITIGAATSRIVNFERVCAYFNSATTISTIAPSSTAITDTNALGNPKVSVSLNPSNDWRITITAQLNSTSDSCSVDSVRIGKLKK
jgi:hypothetical protein